MSSNIIYVRSSVETPGDRYQRALGFAKRIASGDFSGLSQREAAIAKREVDDLNKFYLALKKREISPDQVQDDRFLTNLSVQYGNDEYIGLMLMPPAAVPNLSGEYPTYDKSTRLEGPDDEMNGRSTPNEIDDGNRSTGTYQCSGRSLKNTLDWVTLMNQVSPLNEMIDLTGALLDVMAIKREIRIATALTTSGNFASANVVPVAASNYWDSAGGGDPIGVFQDATSRLWKGRGPAKTIAYTSLEVWNVVSRHPAILDLSKHTVRGLATPQSVAEYFGWDGILVSQARRRTSRKGQTATYSRMYGNNFGIIRVATSPSVRNAVFGHTFRWQGERTRVWFDPALYTDGGYVAKHSHHEDYKIIASDTGALITTPITPF
jgi:hypothetical protein